MYRSRFKKDIVFGGKRGERTTVKVGVRKSFQGEAGGRSLGGSDGVLYRA